MELEDLGAGGGRRGKGSQRGGKRGQGGGNGQEAQPGRGGRAGQASPVDPHGGGGGSKCGRLPGGGQSKVKPSNKAMKKPRKSLRDTILSWHVNAISADDNKVTVVPGFHESIEDYMTTYSNLLVQDCRANIKDSLKHIRSAPSYKIEAILRTKSVWKHFIDIDLNLEAKGNYHVAREGDIFLFSYHSPNDTRFDYFHKSIGIASDISPHSKFHQGFKAYTPNVFAEFKYATFLTNVICDLNVWNAMHLENSEDNYWGIKSIMKLTEPPNTDCTHCPKPVGLNNFVSSNLSEQQKNIVNSVAQAVHCKECRIVKLVSGPPGSGKTLIVSEVVHILHQLPMKILICVPTESDIISLLSTLEGSKYPLNDLLVLDNLDDRGLNTKTRQVCLVDRSHDLLCCIQMFNQLVHEMLLLLNLKMFCAKGCSHESRTRCSETGLPIFTMEIFRDNFCILVSYLRHYLVQIKDRFSDMFLKSENISDIVKLLDNLKNLENLVSLEIEDEKGILRAFGYASTGQSTSGLHDRLVADDLNRVRLECSKALENLKGSVELPKEFADRTAVENYCIQKCQVVISTVCSAFRLHRLNPDQIGLLIVDDASDIRECDLAVPLRLSVRHVLMLGDDNIQPLANMVADKDGYSNSLFKRLSQLGFPVDKLMEKFLTDPAIVHLENKDLIDAYISDGEQFKHLNPQKNNLFYDVDESYYNESIDSVEEDVIVDMLGALCRCWEDVERKLEVAVLCLYSNRADEVKSRLLNKHSDRISLHVKCLNTLDEEMYDVIIMSAISEDHDVFAEDQDITSALTKARHCRWTLFQRNKSHDGVFKQLLDDAAARNCIIKLNTSLYSVKDRSGKTDTFANNPGSQRVTTESTWQGRPYNTKDILADMRDQKSTDTCTLHSSLAIVESLKKFQYAGYDPPKDFQWTLSADNLGIEFKKIVEKGIGEEVDMAHRGFYRLETVQTILKDTGAIVHNPLRPKEETRFKIKSYSRLDIKENRGMDDAVLAIRNGTVLSGYFRISRNYFYLKPGEIYHYDRTKPYLSPLFYIPASHVVMMIGSGVTNTSTELPSGDLNKKKTFI